MFRFLFKPCDTWFYESVTNDEFSQKLITNINDNLTLLYFFQDMKVKEESRKNHHHRKLALRFIF